MIHAVGHTVHSLSLKCTGHAQLRLRPQRCSTLRRCQHALASGKLQQDGPSQDQPAATIDQRAAAPQDAAPEELSDADPTTSLHPAAWRWLRSKHDAAILDLALPALLALAADPLLGLVDTAFVGRLGPDELAALGVNTALFTLVFVVFSSLSTATTPLIATSLASNKAEQAGRVTWQALMLAGVLGTALAAGLHWGADGALALMGAPDDGSHLHALSQEYLQARLLATPAVLVASVGQGAFRGLGDMRVPLAITLAANAVNLALDPLLIFGAGWGARGAGVATAVAEWVAAVAYLTLLWRRRRQLGLAVLPSFDLAKLVEEYLPFLTAGAAVLARTALLLGTKTLAATVATRQGAVSIASHQVLMQLWMLSSFLLDSLAVAGQTLVAVNLGQGRTAEARQVSNRLLQLGLVLGSALMLGLGAASPIIPGLFSSDTEVCSRTAALLPIALVMLPINSCVYVLDGVFVGASDFRYLALAMLGAAGSTVVLLTGFSPEQLQLQGVWYSLAVLNSGRLVMLLLRYNSDEGPVRPLR